ncbi:DUF1289 domain-containing protein [Imbroritus primus]|uniref:DUF1289 domain-containing protein n=1 Tax=Imbroritus primus TaxID=3058603 RepID=A0ACD3SLP4_9BURK|nr:DUF1289 domain-containing protein [Burkholderiaceae bacterium PBA]
MTSAAYLRAARRIRRLAPPILAGNDGAGGSTPSPCNSVCRMDRVPGSSDDWCLGCLRTLDEIASWSTLEPARQRAIWLALLARAEQLVQEG